MDLINENIILICNISLMIGGFSCLIAGAALVINGKEHRDLCRRRWIGYEVFTISWLMIGLIVVAMGIDAVTPPAYQYPQWLYFSLGVLLTSASAAISLLAIRGHNERLAGQQRYEG